MGRLVLLSGTAGAVGKTTTAQLLVTELAASNASVEFVREDVIFQSEELTHLAAAFRRREFPSADDLLDGFRMTFNAVVASNDWVVHDGAWLLTGEDLPWGQASRTAIVDYARRLWQTAKSLNSTVLYLSDDVEAVVERLRQREGDETLKRWLATMRRLPAYAHVEDDACAVVGAFATRVRSIWEEAGVPLVDVPVGREPADTVQRVLRTLASTA